MSWITDIADYLEDSGVGTVTQNIFVGRKVDSDLGELDNIVVLYETGGVPQDMYLPTKEVTFQVYVRNSSYAAGRAKIEAVRSALHQVIGDTLGSTYFYNIFAQSAPGHIGRDEPETGGREEFSINFIAKYR